MRTWTHEERIAVGVELIAIGARGRHVAGVDPATIREELRADLRELIRILPATETPEILAESIVALGERAIADAVATPPTEAEQARYRARLAEGRDPEMTRAVGYLDAAGGARLIRLADRQIAIIQAIREEQAAYLRSRGFDIPDDPSREDHT
jgi:hypothetical protein